ncbi:hypothetical protein TcasGA2_TC003106 [Tribolium castaneum]|uniref:Uncharacterized protein n=1 Tax=Tribolium castaneum TaxID=7070 RepID=D6WFB7_TRICA|nr:hypothetical protein TcasGA2_TC003106 [Tribolium castaneum]
MSGTSMRHRNGPEHISNYLNTISLRPKLNSVHAHDCTQTTNDSRIRVTGMALVPNGTIEVHKRCDIKRNERDQNPLANQ